MREQESRPRLEETFSVEYLGTSRAEIARILNSGHSVKYAVDESFNIFISSENSHFEMYLKHNGIDKNKLILEGTISNQDGLRVVIKNESNSQPKEIIEAAGNRVHEEALGLIRETGAKAA